MSFDVYFEQDGDMWVEQVDDGNHVAFNFIKVENKDEYLAITQLLIAKKEKLHKNLHKKVKTITAKMP